MSEKPSNGSSYGQILRSSSILGGSQILIYLTSVARAKVAALLLGPSGVGTLSLYQSIVTLIGTASALGIGDSGVREIAEANGRGNPDVVWRTAGILRKMSFLCGMLGWILAAVLAYPISRITFEDGRHTVSIIWLGSCLLLGSAGTFYGMVLHGTRRIGTLAKYQVTTVAGAAVVAILAFCLFGQNGIVPSIIAGYALTFALTLVMGRSLFCETQTVSWREALCGSKRLIAMGLAFMWNAVSTGLVAFGCRALVVRYEGLDANGIYQAAWAISGMFAGFVLQAMGTDFYPRLTAESDKPDRMTQLINEQTEIGLLLAGPGVLTTLSLTPYLLHLLYSERFVAGTPLICWFVLGVFGQIVSWPLGFIQVARGASRAFILTQTLTNGAHFALIAGLFRWKGIEGIAIAYPVLYGFYLLGIMSYARWAIGFRWSKSVFRLVVLMGLLVFGGFLLAYFRTSYVSSLAGLTLALVSGVFSTRELVARLPEDHRLSRLLARIPCFARRS